MAFDSNNTLREDVLKHADIVKVISSFLNVTKKGKDFVAICPFHDDTNPSMSISPSKRMFKCFVCGTGGDAISFVQKYLHVSHLEAMKKVAEISGYNDPRLEKNIKPKYVDEKKVSMLKCLQDLTLYYQYALNTEEGKKGLEYFESRQLDANLRSKYQLGYAFKDGKTTIQFLQSKGHSLKTIEDVGISFINNSVQSDRNQGRVIFPICDDEGNVVGYSARRIKDGPEAKYVNSPETKLFTKNKILYNFHIAKEKARIAGHIYVLEGFMDVFALAKVGIDNAVAIMGTALTQEHIALLRGLNVEVRLCLDGDLAGQTAMMKVAKSLEESGLKLMIVNNQNNTKDPDEILKSDGPDGLKLYLNNLLSRVDFALEYFKNTNPLKTMEQKKKLVAEFLPMLLNIKSQLELDNYIRKLSVVTGFDVDAIRDLVKRNRQKNESVETIVKKFRPEAKILKRLQLAEREMLYQMIYDKEAIKFYEDNVGGFYEETYRQIANYIVDYAAKCQSFGPYDILSYLEETEIENKDELIKELTTLCFENNHPKLKDVPTLLDDLLSSINKEKEDIFEKDTLEQSLKGKSEIEKARILAEHNRRRMRKEKNDKEGK